MSIVVVFDSVFGNTGQVAKAIADAAANGAEVRLLPVREAGGLDLGDVDLLVAGSPTRGFRPTPEMLEFVNGLDAKALQGLPAAAFDTRIDLADVHPAPLRWVISAGGYAADVLASTLARRGAATVGTPAGFCVGGTEGPLKPGEIERAEAWAREVAAKRRTPDAG